MTRLRINGVEEEIAALTLAELLTDKGLGLTQRFIAVAVNGAVVRRALWQETALSAGDAIEIVRPLQGG
jgi:sulfur carrier protein